MPSVFSPLAKTLLDAFAEGVVVFDTQGKVLYANEHARDLGLDFSQTSRELMPQLAELGGRLKPLKVGTIDLGEAMFLPGTVGPKTSQSGKKKRSSAPSTPTDGAWPKRPRVLASAEPPCGAGCAPMASTAMAGASGPRPPELHSRMH